MVPLRVDGHDGVRADFLKQEMDLGTSTSHMAPRISPNDTRKFGTQYRVILSDFKLTCILM